MQVCSLSYSHVSLTIMLIDFDPDTGYRNCLHVLTNSDNKCFLVYLIINRLLSPLLFYGCIYILIYIGTAYCIFLFKFLFFFFLFFCFFGVFFVFCSNIERCWSFCLKDCSLQVSHISTVHEAESKSLIIGAEVVNKPILPLNFSGVKRKVSRC